MILTTFKSAPEVASIPPIWFPREWHPENFSLALQYLPFGRYLLNTLFIALSVVILETTTSACPAYAFARLRFRGRDLLFPCYLGTLMIPRHVMVIPLFMMMRDLHWIDTYQGLIIPQVFSAFGTFLLRQFNLSGVPIRYIEPCPTTPSYLRFDEALTGSTELATD